MVKDRNAAPTVFGFEFQVYAGIYLMLCNMASMSSLKVEGEDEDIELALKDGSKIYIQAKAFIKPFEATKSQKKAKLKLALTSLNNVKGVSRDLLYVTNLSGRNPLMDDLPEFDLKDYNFGYNELPKACKDVIDKIIKDEGLRLDVNKLRIVALTFFGEDMQTRRDSINNKLKEMLEQSRTGLTNLSGQILDRWHACFYFDGSTRKGCITKDDIIYDLVFFSINTFNGTVDILADKLDINEIAIQGALQEYDRIIEHESTKFLKYNLVIQMYEQYYSSHGAQVRVSEFVTSQADALYAAIFDWEDKERSDDEKDNLRVCAQIIAYKILFRKQEIQRIKKGVETYGY